MAREILIPEVAEPKPDVEEITITPDPGLPDPSQVPIAVEPIVVARPQDVAFAVPIESPVMVSTVARQVTRLLRGPYRVRPSTATSP